MYISIHDTYAAAMAAILPDTAVIRIPGGHYAVVEI